MYVRLQQFRRFLFFPLSLCLCLCLFQPLWLQQRSVSTFYQQSNLYEGIIPGTGDGFQLSHPNVVNVLALLYRP